MVDRVSEITRLIPCIPAITSFTPMRWAEICAEPHPIRYSLNHSARHSPLPVPLKDVHQLVYHNTSNLVTDALRVAAD